MRFSGLIATAAMVVVSRSAFSQVAAYEVIDLGLLPSATTPTSKAFGLNNRHEIVGMAIDSTGQTHAVIWLFCPNYGITEGAWYDLTASAGLTDLGEAYGINEAGLVVGTQDPGSPVYVNRPYVWDVAAATSLALNTFYDDPYGVGAAFDVNNSSPAMIVGTAQANVTCTSHAFLYMETDPPYSLTDLGVDGTDSTSEARGVNDASSPRASGISLVSCYFNSCQSTWDAANWSMGTTVLTVMPDSGSSYGAEAWGINDADYSVGKHWTSATSPCKIRAAFWASASSSVTDLGAVGITSTDESQAYRLNGAGGSGEVTAVGTNLTGDLAWRWYRNGGGTWSSADLNTLVSPCWGWTQLAVARDVSDDGWIVGYGYIGGETHGFLLRPMCVGDLNEDCRVDGGDLGALLGAWGTLPSCFYDLNLDGQVVDGGDLGILLGNWGRCFQCSSSSCDQEGRAAMESEDDLAGSPMLSAALALLGFDSVQAFNAWSATASDGARAEALEWLGNYLTSQV